MAHKYICDGCGKAEDSIEDFTVRGHVLKTIYCEKCLGKVDEFLTAIDEAHTKAAKSFQAAIKRLRKKYSTDGFMLPDGGNIKVEGKEKK